MNFKSIWISLSAILFFLLVACRVYAQDTDIVKNPGITSELHRANIGKIIFTDHDIEPDALKSTDFLSNYQLTNKSNLFITVCLANANTNYLHQLAPGLSADSVLKVGNYQFSFYVDGKLIYRSELWAGAPQANFQNTKSIWTMPLIDNNNEGAYWSQSSWGRFMRSGGDSMLTDGRHKFRMEIRDYVKTPDLKVGPLLAAGELDMQVYRHPAINIASIHISPVKPYDGLPVSKETYNHDKIKEMIGNIDADVFKHITSVVVLKNGKILIEEYFNGSGRDSLHDVRSVGKSFSSTMVGIAASEGYLKPESQTVGDFYDVKTFENYSPAKGRVALRELLTMSSRFDGDDDDNTPGNEENMYPTPNWVKFVLDLPMDTVKYIGQWHYFTAGVVLLGDILNKSVPVSLESYADIKLFKPLHITNYHWEYTPQKVVNTAGGIQMNALDFAKYGQLYKNNGVWNGRQIIPATWVAKTFTKHKVIPGRDNEYYGYLFWNKTYRVNGKGYETFYCSGNGGNSIFVFKDQPIVVVITATAFGTAYAHTQVDKMMEQYILPAVVQ